MMNRLGWLLAAVVLTGCGTKHVPAGVSTDPAEGMISVRSATSTGNDEATFWLDYPTQIAWVTIKSQKTDYMVVQLSARKLGFNQGAKLFFPVTVQQKVQFNSNLFLGKDKGLYISQLGSGATTDYRFYRVGTFGARTLDVTEGDAIKLRMDPGFSLNASVADGAEGAAPTLSASIDLRAMPNTVSHARLFTRPSAGS